MNRDLANSKSELAKAGAGQTEPERNYVAATESLIDSSMQIGVRRAQAILDRFRAYLIPRMQHLDPVALVAATRRAQADLRQRQQDLDTCGPKCNTGTVEAVEACLARCSTPG